MRFFRFYVILQVLRGFVSKFCPEDRSLLSTRPLVEYTCFQSSRPRVVGRGVIRPTRANASIVTV